MSILREKVSIPKARAMAQHNKVKNVNNGNSSRGGKRALTPSVKEQSKKQLQVTQRAHHACMNASAPEQMRANSCPPLS
jgi:hypothetical protein